MSLYQSLQAVADKLIGSAPLGGKSMTIKRSTPGAFDPVTGMRYGATDELIPVVGISLPFDDKLIDGTRVLVTDKRVTLTSAVAPLVSDALIIDGITHQIVAIKESEPTDTTLVYVVQARAV